MKIKEKKSFLILTIIGLALVASGITLVAFNPTMTGGVASEMGHSGDEIRVDVSGSEKNLNTALGDLDNYLNNIETNALQQLQNCESDLSDCNTDLTNTENSLSTCQSDLGTCEASACSFCECSWNGWYPQGATCTIYDGGYVQTYDVDKCEDTSLTINGVACSGEYFISKKCEGNCITDLSIRCTEWSIIGPAK